MKIAENRYIRRKIDLDGNPSEKNALNRLEAQYNDLISGKERKEFDPANIVSIEKDYRRSIIK